MTKLIYLEAQYRRPPQPLSGPADHPQRAARARPSVLHPPPTAASRRLPLPPPPQLAAASTQGPELGYYIEKYPAVLLVCY